MANQSALDLALQVEQEGHDYYTKNARQAANPLAHKVFISLAEQELQHAAWIKQLAEGASVPEIDRKTGSIEKVVKSLFDELSEQERAGWKRQNTEVYKQAMELEKKSYHLYKELSTSMATAEQRSFFQQLMEMENEHLISLQNVYYYLTETKDWFSQQEPAAGWNWMTT